MSRCDVPPVPDALLPVSVEDSTTETQAEQSSGFFVMQALHFFSTVMIKLNLDFKAIKVKRLHFAKIVIERIELPSIRENTSFRGHF